MKLSLVAAIILLTSTSLHTQEIKPDKKMLQRALAYKINGLDTIRNFSPRIEIVPGSRVETLPQDGMPCIVPDTNGIAAMPNVLLFRKPAQPVPGQIPNAWHKREPKEDAAVR